VSNLCFVIGPIGEEDSEQRIHADWLLEGVIQPVLKEFTQFIVKRADKDPRPGLIDAQLIEDLLDADLVIADLSFFNPNAYYEIGIRHMAQKPIIHMQLKAEKPPFDLSLYRAIKFALRKPSDLSTACNELKEAINAVLAKGYEVDNPVTRARGRIKLKESASSEGQVLLDQMKAIQDRMDDLEISTRIAQNNTLRALAPNFGYASELATRFGPSPSGPFANTPATVTYDDKPDSPAGKRGKAPKDE
jgi:hypothetical protein